MSRWLAAALLAAVFAAHLGLRSFLDARETTWVPLPEVAREKWPARVVRAFSLGAEGAVVDGLWLRFLQDTTLTRVARGTRAAVYADLDLASDLDPAFFEVYASGAPLLAVVRDDVDGALALLEKAARFIVEDLPGRHARFTEEHWKDRWLVHMVRAYIHLFEKGDLPGAAEAFRAARAFPGSPPYLESLVGRLEQPGGQVDVARGFLRMLISRERNPDIRARYEEQLQSLEVHAYLQAIQSVSPSRVPETDPWGGRIFRRADGSLDTTTPRRKVLGIGED